MKDLLRRFGGLAPFDPEPGGGSFVPRTVDELAALTRAFRQEGEAVGLRGSGAGPWWARRDPAPLLTIRMAGIAGDPEIAPLDLVMTAKAGLGVARARSAAREAGLDLMLEDPPCGPCTIGGLLARGEGRGSQLPPAGPRAVVLGIDAVLPDGRLVRCGGRVVKNVAGYDTHRLFVGSLGTLGAIARVHLKLVPSPGVEEWHASATTLAAAIDRAEAILRRAPQVGSLAVDCALGSASGGGPAGADLHGSPALLRVRLCGSRRRVEILRDRLSAELSGSREDEAGERYLAPVDRPRASGSIAGSHEDPGGRGASTRTPRGEAEPSVLVRAVVPPKEIRALLARWDAVLLAGSLAARARIHPGVGEVWLLLDRPVGSGMCEAIARACRPNGKFLAAWRAADGGGPTWDPVPAMLPFWFALRARLDPGGLWNPGILPFEAGG